MAKGNRQRGNFSRIRRLLKLIGLLQSGRGHNVNSLAQECGVTRRTVFRDLDALRESGVPLQFDRDHQRYHIPGTYFLPPTNFTAEEALAVLVLCHELGEPGRLPFYETVRTAAIKLENALPHHLRDYLRSVTDAVHIHLDATNPLTGQRDIYQQLVGAIGRRRCVRIRYDSFSEQKHLRTKLSPYQLLFSRRSWYVIGRSSIHRAVRTFNVGRIGQIESLEEGFQRPRGFSLARYLRNAWHLIPERGPDQRVVVRFSPQVARNVAEVMWHKTQHAEFHDDGSLHFHATVSGLNEISWWVLGYGDQAEVLNPPRLREIVAKHAKQMARTYGV